MIFIYHELMGSDFISYCIFSIAFLPLLKDMVEDSSLEIMLYIIFLSSLKHL